MKRRDALTLWEQLYLPQIVGGLMIIIYRFWRNSALHMLHAVGVARGTRARSRSSIRTSTSAIRTTSAAATG